MGLRELLKRKARQRNVCGVLRALRRMMRHMEAIEGVDLRLDKIIIELHPTCVEITGLTEGGGKGGIKLVKLLVE